MRFRSFQAVCCCFAVAACSSGYSTGTSQLTVAQADDASFEQTSPDPSAIRAASGRYDPETDTFVPTDRAAGASPTTNSAPAVAILTESVAAANLAAPASPVKNIAYTPTSSPAGEVPLLVQTCLQSVSGAFGRADGLAQRGYKVQRASESRRKFYRKFPVSTAAALNGSYRSSALELRANQRRSENYCSLTITTNESPENVSSSVRGTLASSGFRESGGGVWSNGSRQLQVSQFLSGSRVAWTISVNITEGR